MHVTEVHSMKSRPEDTAGGRRGENTAQEHRQASRAPGQEWMHGDTTAGAESGTQGGGGEEAGAGRSPGPGCSLGRLGVPFTGAESIAVTAGHGRFVLPRTHLKFLPCKFGFKGHLGTLPTEASCKGTTGHNKGHAS